MEASFAAQAAALRERLDAPEPITWRPDDPQSGHDRLLIGELVAVTGGTTSFGERQIAVIADGERQMWNVWLLHSVLIDEFTRQQPKIGEILAIRYEGRVEPEPGSRRSAYEKYTLVVHREGAKVDWRPAAPGAEEPRPPAQRPAPFAGVDPPEPPPAPAADVECEGCGFRNGKHAPGCPVGDDIPF